MEQTLEQDWYFVLRGQRSGPVTHEALASLIASGEVDARALVWRSGMAAWTPANQVPDFGGSASAPAAPATPEARPHRGILRDVTDQLSDLVDAPTIGDVPIKSILFGRAEPGSEKLDPEEVFACGSAKTSPALAEISDGWPRVRIAWRILAAGVVAFGLMLVGFRAFQNDNVLPGLLVIGGFAVPLALTVLFFEINTPRNVSVYAVLKMISIGGILSLIATLVLASVFASGTGRVGPAFMTGLIEEAAKVVPLLLVLSQPRYRWQLNGLLLGAAVGAGFAGFESAGYAARGDLNTILVRGALAPGGHVIWCALVASAIWKVKGDKPFDMGMLVHPTVLKRFAAAAVLHGLWDTDLGSYIPFVDFPIFGIPIYLYLLIVVGWYLIFAVMKQALAEVQLEKQRLLSVA